MMQRRTFLARLAASIAAIAAAPDAIKAMGLTQATPLRRAATPALPDYAAFGPHLDIRKRADDTTVTLSYEANVPVEVRINDALETEWRDTGEITVRRPRFGEQPHLVRFRATKDGQTTVHQSSIPPRARLVALTEDGDWHDPSTWDRGRVPDADDCVLIPSFKMVTVHRDIGFTRRDIPLAP